MDQFFLDTVKENFIKQIKELDEQEKYFLIEEKITQAAGDEMDLMTNGMESDFLLKMHNRNTLLRKKIFYVLKKVIDGSYGSCEECNQKISTGRLMARPTAVLCIQCKEGQEKEEFLTQNKESSRSLWSTKMEQSLVANPNVTLKAIHQGEF